MSDKPESGGKAAAPAPAEVEATAGATTPAAPAKPAAKPARELPTEAQIAAWVAGEDLPILNNLFNLLNTKLFDTKVMQIKKEELLPQHWQVISRLTVPEDSEFDALAEVGRLRLRYRDQELARRRIGNLRVGWQELRGRRPSMWDVSDLFAAMRRIIDKNRDVDFHELLSAVRDVWRDLGLPRGKEQLEVLWACLDLIRRKTKK